jgi:Asp-tRNA(Asn)/Glu-tRNA(Gln) amidotransferase A subunit family amidase
MRRLVLALFAALLGFSPLAQAADKPFEVIEATVDDVHAAMKAGHLTARALVETYIARIEALDKKGPTINSVISINPAALTEADRLDAAFKKGGLTGPLHGIPILVKDEVDAAGMATTLGTVVFKDYVTPKDALAVDQLRKQGAIILGKTTLSEYAAGDTYGSLFGATKNPYALDRTAGGSSGGSGAALAANFSTLAIGEETSSSIRRPAAWGALTALRPTPGLVSRSGMWDGYPSPVAQMGPMARTVKDLALMTDGMVGYDPGDPVTALGVGKHKGSYTQYLDRNGLKGARIGVLQESIGQNSEPASEDFKKVDAVFQKAVSELKAAGATVVDPIVIPDLKKLHAITARDPETADVALKIYLARNPTSPFKTREDIGKSPVMNKSIPPSKADQWVKPLGKTDKARYADYVRAREQLMVNVANVMAANKLDAIVLKTVEHQPNLIKEGMYPPYKPTRGLINLNTFLVFTSVITVPAGFTSDDIPVGMTFFGLAYSEPTLFKLAYAYEQATRHRKPPSTTPALDD